MRENTFHRWGMLMQIILVKLTLYFTEKYQKPKISLFHFLAKPRLTLKMLKNQTISIQQSRPLLHYY